MPDPEKEPEPDGPHDGGDGGGSGGGEGPLDWLETLNKVLREIVEQLPANHYAFEILFNEPHTDPSTDVAKQASDQFFDVADIARDAVAQGWRPGGETAVLWGNRMSLRGLLVPIPTSSEVPSVAENASADSSQTLPKVENGGAGSSEVPTKAEKEMADSHQTPPEAENEGADSSKVSTMPKISGEVDWSLRRSDVDGGAADWLDTALLMHEQVFSYAFYKGEELRARLNEWRVVFAIVDEEGLHGYIYVEADPELGEGRIEFLAVVAQDWGKGIGRALMTAAVRWLFSFPEIKEITLLCENDNVRGLVFYDRLGFQLLHVMQSFISPDENA